MMKKIYLLILVLIPFISFGAWSQPLTTPPGGNTDVPINIGATSQAKISTIGATGFCIVNSSRTAISCLGNGKDFPWENSGDDILNTNTGNVLINSTSIPSTWTKQKLTVGGGVQATKFCLGLSCIDINTGVAGDTVNNWRETVMTLMTNGDMASCQTGELLSYSATENRFVCVSAITLPARIVTGGTPASANYITKWSTTAGVIQNSLLYDNGTAVCLGGTSGTACINSWDDAINNFGVSSIVGGKNIAVSPVSGKGAVTVNYVASTPTAECAVGQVPKWNGTAWSCLTLPLPLLPVACNSAGQVLKWNATTNNWDCSTDIAGAGVGPGTVNRVSKFTTATNVDDSNIMDTGTYVTVGATRTGTTGAQPSTLVTGGGFIIETRATNPASPETGRMWLIVP